MAPQSKPTDVCDPFSTDEWDADEWEAFQDLQLEDPCDRRVRWAARDAVRAARRNPHWPDTRLESELDALRGRYFPLLRGTWTVGHALIATESDTSCVLGRIDFSARHISIDLCRRPHRSARQIRSTLLHELCHASVGQPGHGMLFFRELERLLMHCAPLSGDEFDVRLYDVPGEASRCRCWAEHRQRRQLVREWARVSWEQRRFPFCRRLTDRRQRL